MTVILKILTDTFKDFEVSDSKFAIWYELLGDLDFKIVKTAVEKLILQSPYVPSISDIRKQVVEIIHPTIDAVEAYSEVRRAIKEYGHDRAYESFGSMSPLTRKVCEYMGWWNICMSEEPEIVRGQFLKMYAQLQDRVQKEMLLPEGFKEEILALSESKKLAQRR
jgi:hypothetical protein